MKRYLLIFAAAAIFACSKPNDKPTDDYLVKVTHEWTLSKSQLTTLLSGYASSLGVPPSVLALIVKDVKLATITYRTTNVDGTPVVASGVIAIPADAKDYDHLTSLQHGTLDIGDAPSEQKFYLELIPVFSGHITIAADYLGYGASQTPDRQTPYLHLRSTGIACADMIEASREYLRRKGIRETDTKLDLVGYSQGGTSTIATLLELERRNQTSRIRTVWAGGGVYDLEGTLQSFTTPYPYLGFVPYIFRGIAWGECLTLNWTNIYAPTVNTAMFATTPLSAWHNTLGTDIAAILNPDFFAPDYNNNPDILMLTDALRRNSATNLAQPATTVQLFHSPSDDVVPCANSATLNSHWTNSTLTELSTASHFGANIEFLLRYMGIWAMING